FHGHLWCQLVANCEVAVQDLPLFYLFRVGKASIDLADRLTDQILYRSVVRSLRLRRLAVERDQRRHEGAAFTEHDCVGNPRTAAQHVLDRSGCDIFSSGGLEQVLLAVRDLEIAVRVELTDVARFQPSVGERLPRLLRILVVAGENVVAANQEDRKSTRLNSSHVKISYAVFCLQNKSNNTPET